MKKLYKFKWDCGRQGDVEGVFVAEEEGVRDAIGKDICFGEILGKHSDIVGTLEKRDIQILSEDCRFIEQFSKIVGKIGYNPLDYVKE